MHVSSILPPTQAWGAVLRSIEGLHHVRALYVLAVTFAATGLLLAMAERSFASVSPAAGPFELIAAALVAFYGSNAAGLLLMDQAAGRPIREVPDAIAQSVRTSHRLLAVIAALICGIALIVAPLVGALWLTRPGVTGAVVGPLAFGLLVPLGVLFLGLTALATVAVLVPLAAPGVWAGDRVGVVLQQLMHLVRKQLVAVAMLMGGVALLAAAVGAAVSFMVSVGGRLMALLTLTVVGIDMPPTQLMAGLFGYGLRTLGASGAPIGPAGHAAAALVGGGVVFALALLLPTLVSLRGACAVYLVMTRGAHNRDEWTSSNR